MNFIKRLAVLIGLTGVLTLSLAAPVNAQVDIWAEGCRDGDGSAVCEARNNDSNRDISGIIEVITSTLLFLLGAVAVIMIIVSGFKYVASGGDQAKVTSAKNTLMYSVVGLVVAVASYAIVSYVLSLL